ncbi:(R)-specific enoyl-CoA hydratase [bioreactor metagenome]|uniref:(R)-specific enoyl-CoA hydratase n=1 Tax=bioreactor metagenome TaxID=1076179 RepID=A0A644Z4X9_9ZZZZ
MGAGVRMEKPFYIPYDQIKTGHSAEMTVVMEDGLVREFSRLIGDTDSFHVSDEAAGATVFGSRICHGVHLLAYVSVAIGQKLPGFGTVYLSHAFTFDNPVYIGDRVVVSIKVLEKLDGRRLRLDTTITRGDGELVLTGQAVVKTYR